MKKLYVYVDYRKDDLRPFYVGKGSWQRAFYDKKRNRKHSAICKKHGWYRVIVNEVDSESEAFRIEKSLIRMLETRHEQGGANFTEGGDGTSGYKHSVGAKSKIASALLGHKRNLGRKVSAETRKKQSAAMLGRRTSNETKVKIGDANRGRRVNVGSRRTPEQCEKMSAAQVGNKKALGCKRSPVTRAAMADAKLGEKNPMWGKRPWNFGITASEETRKKISAYWSRRRAEKLLERSSLIESEGDLSDHELENGREP